jgi:hypothetical protein
MLRRCCRRIIVLDAGEDASAQIPDPLKAALTYRNGVLLAVATCFTLRRAATWPRSTFADQPRGAMRLTLDTAPVTAITNFAEDPV